MSFLGDIVNSIGSGKAPTPPKPPGRPLSANSLRPAATDIKVGARLGAPAAPSPLNGTKRKADDDNLKPAEKQIRPNPAPSLTGNTGRRVAAPPLNAPKPSHDKPMPAARPKLNTAVTAPKPVSTPPTTPTLTPGKPAPAKGSFADIMARAKMAQETKNQTQVGMIKHQATNREKISKVAERKRQEEEKLKGSKVNPKTRPSGKEKARSVSPVKKDQPRVAKVPRPPLHAPASSYKGTMGRTASKPRQPADRKRNRYDEYLATDEEEDSGGDGYGDEDDYESDASSDMEAGAFDIDEEESLALRAAKEDDARELALEQRLKQEKEERRKRLMGLASKNRSR